MPGMCWLKGSEIRGNLGLPASVLKAAFQCVGYQ